MVFHWQIMDEDEFWAIVAALGTGEVLSSSALTLRLASSLGAMKPRRVRGFAQRLSILCDEANHWSLWGAARLFSGTLVVDDFSAFVANIVLRGEEAFRNACREPDRLATVFAEDDDPFASGPAELPAQTYDELTGKGAPKLPPRINRRRGGHPSPDYTLPELFPRLWGRLEQRGFHDDFRSSDGIAELHARLRQRRLGLKPTEEGRPEMTRLLRDALCGPRGYAREEIHVAAPLSDFWGDGLDEMEWIMSMEEALGFDEHAPSSEAEYRWQCAIESAWGGRGFDDYSAHTTVDDFVELLLNIPR